MKFPRTAGILLHPTSLPSRHGIGDLGPAAREFLRFLADAGQSVWQILPLAPTGYGDSPYQCFSAFAGNPMLISLEDLGEPAPELPAGDIDFAAVQRVKKAALERAAARADRRAVEGFAPPWLEDYALFMALKEEHGMVAWPHWPAPFRDRDPQALQRFHDQHAERIFVHKFAQFVFFEQWNALRDEAHRLGLSIMGDIPIYAAGDSADVWARPELWRLDQVSGVPPDYFSATGQLWGNPIYRWDRHAEEGFRWWIERFRATFAQVDRVRLDHFRGFQAYWQVPAGETTALRGAWVEGPGAALFEAVEKELGALPIVAENLGVITPEVESIRRRFGYPGMAILQFAFGKDPQAPDFKPHNYPREIVAYSGTHDNDTTVGWWTSTGEGDSTRTPEDIAKERAFTLEYLGVDGREIHWSFIRALMASVADTVIFPAQDLLGLGSEARMNMPSTLGRNWKFRMRPGDLTPQIAARLRRMAETYDRLPPR